MFVAKLQGAVRNSFASYLPIIRDHLRILDAGDSAEDELLLTYFAAAIADAEKYTDRAISWGLYSLTLDRFPPNNRIVIPRPPVASRISGGYAIESIIYFIDAEEKTLPAHRYHIFGGGDTVARIGAIGEKFPHSGPVEIQYWAGYEFGLRSSDLTATYTHEPLPDAILAALLDLTAARYSIRSSEITGLATSTPTSISAIDTLNRYRVNPHLFGGL